MMNYYVDKFVKNCIRIFPEQGRYQYYRYDMNENPEGLPKEFVNNVLKEITPEFLSTYPEPDVFLNKYSSFIGVNYENVLATNGLDMAIRYILEIFCEKGKKVVTVNPSFEMYAVNCSILGLIHVPIKYENDITIDIEKIINAIDLDTHIVVLVNPNNPTGNAYTEEEIYKVIKKAKECGAIVVIDEAYHYFYNETFLPHVLEYDNVIILRTFSKLFSLAACRLGVIISNKQIINYIRNSRLTFDVNSIALKFAERIIEQPELIKKLIDEEKEGKAYISDILLKNGYEIINGLGNYVLIKTKCIPKELAEKLKTQKKILVKVFNNPILKDYIRVSTGSTRIMEIFIKGFLELDHKE